MGLFDLFSPKPKPVVIIRNVLGEEIDRVEGVDLANKDLKNRDWRHAQLSGLLLDGSDISGSNLLGAQLKNTSFARANLANCEVSFANADGASFYRANLDACLMYRTDVRHANFDEAKIEHDSDIPNWRSSYTDKASTRSEGSGPRVDASFLFPGRYFPLKTER
jgi:uncharacterized protein YjbI with pentapeptide repeats